MSNSWHSYPKIYNLGHASITDLFNGPVTIEEKVDGSQFSFGAFYQTATVNGVEVQNTITDLRFKSKGATINEFAPPNLFKAAVETVRALKDKLHVGWTYRGEVLAKPKHNCLCYGRVPVGNIILFDVNTGEESYLPYQQKLDEAQRLGLECVPALMPPDSVVDVKDGYNVLRGLLDTTSVLGGQKVEGFVIKNYTRFGIDGKALMGKFVSEAFKEVQHGDWREQNPTTGDIIDRLVTKYKTPARWAKAVQHLREAGQLEGSPRDIGKLVKEVPADLLAEEKQAIQDEVWAWLWPHLSRRVNAGVAEWYKDQLMQQQFEAPTTEVKQ